MLTDDDGKLVTGKGVKLNPYKRRPRIEREYMTDAEILANAGSDLILDGEFYPNYAMFGFKSVATGKYIKVTTGANQRFLSWLMFSYRTIGFNSIHYDLPMLWAFHQNSQPDFLKEISDSLISGMRGKDAAKRFGFQMFELKPMQHIDLIQVCPLGASLKLYGARLHSKRLQDLPFPDYEPLDDWQKEVVDEYNCNDLDVTELIFSYDKMQERLDLRRSISEEYGLDLMSKSDAQMAEAVISKEVGRLNGKFIRRPEIPTGTIYKYNVQPFLEFHTPDLKALLERVRNTSFIVGDSGTIIPPDDLKEPAKLGGNRYQLGIGGLHSIDEGKAYKAGNGYRIKDIDVTSYYPNAIINLNLYPIAMGPNFITIYKGFKDQRVEAKRTKNFTKDKGLKIFLNGVSGKFSDVWSTMYSPSNTIQMNLTGQLSILMLAEMLTCNGMEIISANTDGLVVYYHESQEETLQYWWHEWERRTNFQLEDTDYAAYYARDVNAYFAVKSDGEVKVKGPYSEVGSQSGTPLDNNPIMLICSDAIKAFLSKGTPIEETVMNCQDLTRFVTVRNVKGGAAFQNNYLGKVVRWYSSTRSQDCLRYVTTGNKVPKTDNCMPCMDMPTDMPDDLDRKYYVDECQNILYDIGYLKRPKQMEFW